MWEVGTEIHMRPELKYSLASTIFKKPEITEQIVRYIFGIELHSDRRINIENLGKFFYLFF
jgi:hypothetical protein